MRTTGKVLVLGDDVRSFLATVRSLGRKGIEVHTAWASPGCPTLQSKYIHKNHALPIYVPDSEEWLHALGRLFCQERFDIVIPCDDQKILPLQKERERLSQLARIELLDSEVQRITASKQESYNLASRLGVPVARSIFIQSDDELDVAIRELSAPYVIKPIVSFTLENARIRNEVRKAFLSKQAQMIGREILERCPLQLQENFIGRGTGVEFLASRGNLLVTFQHLRVHEPLHGGGSSYRVAIEVDPRMRAATAAIVGELGYDGVGMIEFKWNPRTDQFIFIEINARFWGSLPLAVACGADFPSFLYDYRVHGRREFPQIFNTGIYARNWVLDVEWFRANMAANRADPLLSTLPWSAVATEFWHVLSGRERVDTLTCDDPNPFFFEIRTWLEEKSRSVMRKAFQKLLELSWVRALYTSKLKARLKTARHIEFVCYGNICRSPFAEAVLRARLTREGSLVSTGSSGFHDHVGRGSPSDAVAVAEERNIDIADHRSQRINRGTVQKSDVILVFDWNNLQQLKVEFPEAMGKTFLLGLLDNSPPLVIADPYGESLETFRQTYTRIENIIQGIMEPPTNQ